MGTRKILANLKSGRDTEMAEKWLCVAGLPLHYENLHFRGLVHSYGDILHCSLVFSERTGKSKGYGLVKYRQVGAVVTAKEDLEGKIIEEQSLWTRIIDVTIQPLHSRCLYVSNLPLDYCDMADFRRRFSVVVEPPYCQIALKNGLPTGWGLVEFSTADDAELTFDLLYGEIIRTKRIKIAYYIPGIRAINLMLKYVNEPENQKNGSGLLPRPTLSTVKKVLKNLRKDTPQFALNLQDIMVNNLLGPCSSESRIKSDGSSSDTNPSRGASLKRTPSPREDQCPVPLKRASSDDDSIQVVPQLPAEEAFRNAIPQSADTRPTSWHAVTQGKLEEDLLRVTITPPVSQNLFQFNAASIQASPALNPAVSYSHEQPYSATLPCRSSTFVPSFSSHQPSCWAPINTSSQQRTATSSSADPYRLQNSNSVLLNSTPGLREIPTGTNPSHVFPTFGDCAIPTQSFLEQRPQGTTPHSGLTPEVLPEVAFLPRPVFSMNPHVGQHVTNKSASLNSTRYLRMIPQPVSTPHTFFPHSHGMTATAAPSSRRKVGVSKNLPAAKKVPPSHTCSDVNALTHASFRLFLEQRSQTYPQSGLTPRVPPEATSLPKPAFSVDPLVTYHENTYNYLLNSAGRVVNSDIALFPPYHGMVGPINSRSNVDVKYCDLSTRMGSPYPCVDVIAPYWNEEVSFLFDLTREALPNGANIARLPKPIGYERKKKYSQTGN